MILKELTAFSNHYGNNSELVLAGGGNTSAKDGDILYIKASGTSLATITPEGFVKMDRALLAKMFEKEYPTDDNEREEQALQDLMAARLPGEDAKRPSVETTLHSLFPQTFVLHLHPALVNGLTCGQEGEKIAHELFNDEFIWIDLCRPGYVLAKLCFDAMGEYTKRTGKAPSIVILQNHGIFFAADTVADLDKMLNNVMRTLTGQVEQLPDLSPKENVSPMVEQVISKIKGIYDSESCVLFDGNTQALSFAQSKESAAPLLLPFTPDHIVYCKAYPLFVDSIESLENKYDQYKQKNGYAPKIIIFQGMGFFAVGQNEKDAMTAQTLFNDAIKVAVYTESFGGPLHMTQELTDFIVNWEVEAYRQKQN